MRQLRTFLGTTRRLALFAVTAVLLCAGTSFAAAPTTTLIEGVLTSSGGGAAADGTYDVTFSLWEAQSGGTATWSEGPVKVIVKGGQFSYPLGTSKPLTMVKLAALKTQWLALKIGSDPALPRQLVHATLFARWADNAGGLTCTGCVTSNHLANNSVAASKMGFNYAGSASKGGPASDLNCTGCVSVKEMKFDGNANFGAYAVTAKSFIGDGSQLTGLKLPKGECTKKGEVVKGINPDGSLKCVLALDPSALPADGLDEISNGLISNQFIDEVAATGTKIPIPDNQGTDAVWNLTFPNIGKAQTIDIHVKVESTDLSTVSMTLLPPDDKKTGWLLCDPCGKKDTKKYDATFSPAKPPQAQKGAGKKIADWIGSNPQGLWTLKVKDTSYCVPQAPGNSVYCDPTQKTDGWIALFTIKLQTLSNQKIAVSGDQSISGNLTVKGAIQMGGKSAKCDATTRGTIRWNGTAGELCDANGWTLITTLPDAFSSSKIITPTQGAMINGWIGNPQAKWKLCYRRSDDGASSSTFHSKCNGKGDTVTIAKLDNGRIIGGYAGCSWYSKGSYNYSCGGSFPFNVSPLGHAYRKRNYSNGSSNSFSHNYWIYDASNYGPTFGGGHDWYVSSNMTTGYCNLGHDYTCRLGTGNNYSGYGSSDCRNDFCGSYNSWKITELEVWYR